MAERAVVDFRKINFVQVTKSVLANETAFDKPIQKLVYAMLCMYADNATKDAFPSIKTLARKCSCSENTIRAALRKLEEVGVIEVKRRYKDDGSRNSNIYFLIDPPDTFGK